MNVAVIHFGCQCKLTEDAVSSLTCPFATLGFRDLQPWVLGVEFQVLTLRSKSSGCPRKGLPGSLFVHLSSRGT